MALDVTDIMKKRQKKKVVSIYIEESDIKIAETLRDKSGLTVTDIYRLAVQTSFASKDFSKMITILGNNKKESKNAKNNK